MKVYERDNQRRNETNMSTLKAFCSFVIGNAVIFPLWNAMFLQFGVMLSTALPGVRFCWDGWLCLLAVEGSDNILPIES